MSLETIMPARLDTIWTLAADRRNGFGRAAIVRRAMLLQWRFGLTIEFCLNGVPLGVLTAWPRGPGNVEICALFAAAGGRHVRALIRQAQLRLAWLHQNGAQRIECRVLPSDRQALRLSRLMGFRPVRTLGDGKILHHWLEDQSA